MLLEVLKYKKSLIQRDLLQIAKSYSELFIRGYLPTQNLLSDAECKICKYKQLIISTHSSNCGDRYYAEGRRRDGKYTKICKYDCRQKKKMQKTAKSIFQFFVYSHSLTRIFAHFCILCEASEMQLPISVHLGTFIFAVLCISL